VNEWMSLSACGGVGVRACGSACEFVLWESNVRVCEWANERMRE
jgi:hypothetical protein